MRAHRSVQDLIRLIKLEGSALANPVPIEGMPPMTFSSAFAVRGASPDEISALPCECPPPLREFWELVRSARLFEDQTYGQWGLEIFSPGEAATATTASRTARPSEFTDGDLVVGQFLGDSDLLLIRCDPTKEDYGTVLISAPLDRRPEWDLAGESFEAFFQRYVAEGGEKFWTITERGGDEGVAI